MQDEYLLLVNNDIKDVAGLVKYRSEQQEKMQRIEDRQQEIYRESSSRKRKIKTEAQYKGYQMWHVEVQEELDELKQEKREIKRRIQLADGIVREDLYTVYYAVSGNEEIVGDKEIEIPGMEQHEDVVEVKKRELLILMVLIRKYVGRKMLLLRTNIVILKKNRQTYMLWNLVKWMMVIRNRFMQVRERL